MDPFSLFSRQNRALQGVSQATTGGPVPLGGPWELLIIGGPDWSRPPSTPARIPPILAKFYPLEGLFSENNPFK